MNYRLFVLFKELCEEGIMEFTWEDVYYYKTCMTKNYLELCKEEEKRPTERGLKYFCKVWAKARKFA